jgi:hypothetical protein
MVPLDHIKKYLLGPYLYGFNELSKSNLKTLPSHIALWKG